LLLLGEYEVNDPAAANVFPRLAAVPAQQWVLASGLP
jgi:hypothetical protein